MKIALFVVGKTRLMEIDGKRYRVVNYRIVGHRVEFETEEMDAWKENPQQGSH